MPHTVVTSFSPEGYKEYGHKFVQTFKEFWPSSVRLVVFHERGQMATGMKDWFPISQVGGHDHWMRLCSMVPLFRGDTGGKYAIRYDARMARKTLIEAHACQEFGGKVFWIDADVITHSKVPDDFLDQVLPDDKLSCHLGRDGWMYTESGFIGFNAGHMAVKPFFQTYTGVFFSGAIFTMPHWHDCMAFDVARKQFPPEMFVNLSDGLPHGTMHPFVNSVLGTYMDHRKGARKQGRSTREDLVVTRSEPYWQ